MRKQGDQVGGDMNAKLNRETMDFTSTAQPCIASNAYWRDFCRWSKGCLPTSSPLLPWLLSPRLNVVISGALPVWMPWPSPGARTPDWPPIWPQARTAQLLSPCPPTHASNSSLSFQPWRHQYRSTIATIRVAALSGPALILHQISCRRLISPRKKSEYRHKSRERSPKPMKMDKMRTATYAWKETMTKQKRSNNLYGHAAAINGSPSKHENNRSLSSLYVQEGK